MTIRKPIRKAKSAERSSPYASIDKAFAVLEHLAAGRGAMGVTEVATALGLEKSSVSRLMKNLTEMGYLDPSHRRGHYGLGPKVLVLARSFLEQNPLIREAQSMLADLANEARASAHLGIIVDGEAVVVAKAPSPEVIQVSTQVGARISAHASALGKVLLASMADAAMEAALARPRARFTRNTIVEKRKLQAAVKDIRKVGFALELEEEHPGVGCIGVPVLDGEGRWIAALSISGPVQGTPFKMDDKHIQMIRERARALSRRLSFVGTAAVAAVSRNGGTK